MAFLDNSGDIILDAVLTDTGRARLAKGDGTFRISKFALADDEIDYELFDGSVSTPHQDLSIMQTPILEAFTNNTSGVKYKLFSLANNPGLFLPVIRPYESNDEGGVTTGNGFGMFLVAVDERTQNEGSATTSQCILKALTSGGDGRKASGLMSGYSADSNGASILINQGLDTTDLARTSNISAELYESQYLIEMDSRLCSLVSHDGETSAAVSFIDDDQIASYYLSQAVNGTFVKTCVAAGKDTGDSSIAGPRGSQLGFALRANPSLVTSTGLFTKLGSTMSPQGGGAPNDAVFYYIDSNIRVTGVTTGSSIDIPVRFVKWKSGASEN